MKTFLYYFFDVMDDVDRKKFKKYILVLFLGSVFSVLGVGAVIPFINILIQPEKITQLSLFHDWKYDNIVLFLTVFLVADFAVKNLASLFLLIYQSKFLFGLTEKIQNKLFSTYMSMPYEYHLNRSTPDLIKNINNETTMLSNYVIAPLGTFLTEFISSCFVFLVLMFLAPIFTLLVSIFLILGVFGFMKILKNRIEHYANIRTKAWSSMTSHVLSGLSGIKEAKLYHCESIFLDTFEIDAVELKSSSAFQYAFQQSPRMLIEFIGLTVVMGVLCGFIFFGKSPRSMFVLLGVFGVAAAQLLPSLNRLTQALAQIKYGIPALKTIYTELQQKTDSQIKVLETKKISKKLILTNLLL